MEFLTNFERRGLERGRAEGRVEGRAEGRMEALVNALLTLLKERFGDIPIAIKERIEHAGSSQLNAWLIATVKANSLEDIFTN